MTEESEEFDSSAGASPARRTHPLAWSRNDAPTPSSRRMFMLIAGFMSIGFVSLAMAYFGPNHTEAWTLRFDRLGMSNIPPGTGFGIELLRLVLFVTLTVWLIGTRFTSSIRALFRIWEWSLKSFMSRVMIFGLIAYFVATESQRHLGIAGAAESMVHWATERGLQTTAEMEIISYKWYLPYTLLLYILVFGGLLAFPLIRFWLSDLQYMVRRTQEFVDYQKECAKATVAIENLKYFAHECQILSRKYIDCVAVICVGIHFEYWIGRYTLSDAGLITMIMGFFVVLFTATIVIVISATFARGIAATDEAILLASAHEAASAEAGTYNILWFLRKVLLGHIGGVAIMSVGVVALHASVLGHSPKTDLDQTQIAAAMGQFEASEETGQRGTRINAGGNSSSTNSIDIPRATRPAQPADCFALTIGVSTYADPGFNLQFADKDAIDIGAAFKKLEGSVFQKVHANTLVNEQADKNQILNQLASLHSQVTQQDLAIVFIAGHGITDQFDDFFFLPHDYDTKKQLDFSGISWNDLSRWLKRMPCMVWVVLDTCHSGRVTQIGGRGVEQQQIDRVTRKAISGLAQSQSGIVITAGSMSEQSALERSDWGHGALTKALLEGFEDSGESRRLLSALLPSAHEDGTLSLGELIFYANKRVNTLTDGKQAVVTNHTGNINMDLIPMADFSVSRTVE